MARAISFLRRNAFRLAAVLVILALWGLSQPPRLSEAAHEEMTARFAFERAQIPLHTDRTIRRVRDVNPDLRHIAGWISSVGASAAVTDADGDGIANDLCHVETRTDEVVVAPIPGTAERYAAIHLQPPGDTLGVAPMGCRAADFDADGAMDFLVYYWGRTPVLFLRQPDGYAAAELIPGPAQRWFTNSATVADLDGDGRFDIVIANYFADGSDLLADRVRATDVMQHSMSRACNGGSTHFLLAEPRGSGGGSPRFRAAPVDLPCEVLNAWTLAVGAADLSGDLLPELYFANDFGPDKLLHNRSQPGALRFRVVEGRRGFATPRSRVLGRDSFKGMGVDFADVNGDGVLDIYVGNISGEYSLFESHFLFVSDATLKGFEAGSAPYVDRGEELGVARSSWSWDTKLEDLDNDGRVEALQATGFLKGEVDRWPELHELATGSDELLHLTAVWPHFAGDADLSGHAHNPVFAAASDGRFYDVSSDLGMRRPEVTRGIASGDFDADGDIDLVYANQWEESSVLFNRCRRCGSHLSLHLRLPAGGAGGELRVYDGHPQAGTTPAIGAEVRVQLPDGRSVLRFVDGGNGHSGQRSHAVHFGLGAVPAGQPVTVELRWRDWHGQVRAQQLRLSPGWHTVELAS